ncbi:MAG TPA: bifunctional adenosylcobinamide kinase/adenosylcobinamide-phosphate guanylyltransferase [Acidimicrobiales bacterium]|nr:bifunctional adenosylcobinamide kinase/adenosylcobinamide-phosphate guanylyltransferase [Acidimicrobiales bacterium]
MLTVLLGGARSGKSALAAQAAAASGADVTFIATAEARDEEMAARIAEHRRDRPHQWVTVEAPLQLERALATVSDTGTVVVDCLTLWVANMIEVGASDAEVSKEASDLAARAEQRRGLVVVVSNEVGSGLVPGEPLGRRYRDLLGAVNVICARQARAAYLVVAGLALALSPLHIATPGGPD